ncbi:hypothetical protein G3I19_01180 [Streptomyces sp. SID10853]|uniref:hypothetical protein n=1 Tax=Streptomyces sp. SID10853 TaxID=2706028 RepID=UPI0013C0C1C7|nr:hypothetical protein [Streptomyces sp. SID10853]NDZ77157.1 hypothetical protein [Streptomyces sp. SID10853]
MGLLDLNVSVPVGTGAGMCALWQPESFAEVTDLDSWEDEIAEDAALVRHIAAGVFVPINIGADGAFQVSVRGVSALGGLDEREQNYRLVSSTPYLLVSKGKIELGGLEAVGSYTRAHRVEIPLDPGRYSVLVHLIDWKAEPGMLEANGKPSAGALPDFVVEIADEIAPSAGHRTEVMTFDRP